MIQILRVIAMGMTAGFSLLFVSRDLLRASASVWIAASATGIVLGILLELANARLAVATEAAHELELGETAGD